MPMSSPESGFHCCLCGMGRAWGDEDTQRRSFKSDGQERFSSDTEVPGKQGANPT